MHQEQNRQQDQGDKLLESQQYQSQIRQIRFEQKYPNIGWTNAVLFRPFKGQPDYLSFYLPSYLVMKIKNFINFDIQSQVSEANVVLILSVYYGNLPKFLIENFKENLQIQFSMNQKIKTNDENVKKQIQQKLRIVKFTIRTTLLFQVQPMQIIWCHDQNSKNNIFQSKNNQQTLQGITNSLSYSPFQLLNQKVLITFNKVQIYPSSKNIQKIKEFAYNFNLHQSDKEKCDQKYKNLKKIRFMINLMDFEDEHFKINMNSPNQSMLGYYSLAESLLKAKYLHTKVQDQKMACKHKLQKIILEKQNIKKKLELEIIQKTNPQNNVQKLINGMKNCLKIKENKIQILKLLQNQKRIVPHQSNQNDQIFQIQQKLYNLLQENKVKSNQNGRENKIQIQKNSQEMKDFIQFENLSDDDEKKFKQFKQNRQKKKIFDQKRQKYKQKKQKQNQQEKNLNPQNNQSPENQKNKIQTIDIIKQLDKIKKKKSQKQRLYFQYASFNVPVFKNPGITLITIFFPLNILTLISLFIYLQDFNDFGGRLANIATLMIAYIAYFQIIRDKIPKFQDIILIQIFIYAQIGSNLLCLGQSYMQNQNISFADSSSTKSVTAPQAGAFFYISLSILVLITFVIIFAYVWHRIFIRQFYTKGDEFINHCQKEEVTQFIKWYNFVADAYFQNGKSKLVPLEIRCREKKQVSQQVPQQAPQQVSRLIRQTSNES